MSYNFRACGCPACTREAEVQEVREFIDATGTFRDIMHSNYEPDEEYNLRLLADRLAGTVTLGDLSAEGARLRERVLFEGRRLYPDIEWVDSELPECPHPEEGWDSA